MTNSLIDRFERMVITVTSPDGQIVATFNNRRRLRLRFADEDCFYEYDAETLTRQINTILRALENGRQVGADELLKRAGFTDSGSKESHWNANNRRYRQAMQEMLCFGQSSDGSIHFDADGTLTDIEVEIDDDAVNRLEPSTFLSELHGAFGDLLRDHADKRYLLKQQHNLVLARIAASDRQRKTSLETGMNEKRESIDSEHLARPGNRRKWLRWGVFLSVLVVVAGAAVVAIVNGYFSDKGQCPKAAPVTEVTKPVSETSEKWLKLIDSGFTPFGKGPVTGATEDLSFGYLLKNTSKYVLYDAHINVSFTDTAGNDPTTLLQKPDRRDNAQVLEDVSIPVIFPGQTVGMGSSITIWSEHGEDPDTGEPTELEKVDYDKLTLDVEMASGQWWEPKNDKHDFTRVAAESVDITGSEPADQEHPDGSEWVSADMEYKVDSGACQTLKAYKPSTVVFDDAGRIVGGDISGSKNNDAEGGTYRVNSGNVRHELTESLPEGGSVKVYPYAHPLKPNLD